MKGNDYGASLKIQIGNLVLTKSAACAQKLTDKFRLSNITDEPQRLESQCFRSGLNGNGYRPKPKSSD